MSYRRIATEEAFSTVEIYQHYHQLLDGGGFRDAGFESLVGFYLRNPNPRVAEIGARMTDLDARRIPDMDASGIAMQVLSLTAPGVQVFEKDLAVALARSSNDELRLQLENIPPDLRVLLQWLPRPQRRPPRSWSAAFGNWG